MKRISIEQFYLAHTPAIYRFIRFLSKDASKNDRFLAKDLTEKVLASSMSLYYEDFKQWNDYRYDNEVIALRMTEIKREIFKIAYNLIKTNSQANQSSIAIPLGTKLSLTLQEAALAALFFQEKWELPAIKEMLLALDADINITMVNLWSKVLGAQLGKLQELCEGPCVLTKNTYMLIGLRRPVPATMITHWHQCKNCQQMESLLFEEEKRIMQNFLLAGEDDIQEEMRAFLRVWMSKLEKENKKTQHFGQL